jgi:hypothetical protein
MSTQDSYTLIKTSGKLIAVHIYKTLIAAGIPAILSYGESVLSPKGDRLMVLVPNEFEQSAQILMQAGCLLSSLI